MRYHLIDKSTFLNLTRTLTQDGNTPLIEATRFGNVAVLQYLLNSEQLDVNKSNNAKRTALLIGCAGSEQNVRGSLRTVIVTILSDQSFLNPPSVG